MSNALKAEKPTRFQPALKLVKTNDLNRDQWLAKWMVVSMVLAWVLG